SKNDWNRVAEVLATIGLAAQAFLPIRITTALLKRSHQVQSLAAGRAALILSPLQTARPAEKRPQLTLWRAPEARKTGGNLQKSRWNWTETSVRRRGSGYLMLRALTGLRLSLVPKREFGNQGERTKDDLLSTALVLLELVELLFPICGEYDL